MPCNRARWPQGFRCPVCGDRRRSCFRRDRQVYCQCRSCRHQTTWVSSTFFQGTMLPLRIRLLAIPLLTSTKTNLVALKLLRRLGVGYKAAWRIKHDQRKSPRDKVMQAMAARQAPRRLSGFVQIDDAYLGGERNGGKPRCGSENKLPFLITVETDAALEHPTYVVIEPVSSFDNASLQAWEARRLAPGVEVYTDGLFCFRSLAEVGRAHTLLAPAAAEPAAKYRASAGSTCCWATSSVRSAGSYHAIRQGKYARLYLAETAYRFRRFRLRETLPRLACAKMLRKPHAEPVLHMVSGFHG